MRDCWIFFHDVFDGWQWEHHEPGGAVVASSTTSLRTCEDCVRDAARGGYRHNLDAAIFPPDFKIVRVTPSSAAWPA